MVDHGIWICAILLPAYVVAQGSSSQNSCPTVFCNIPNYRVVALEETGYVTITRNATDISFSGYLIDLLYALASAGKFTFTMLPPPEAGLGSKNASGCWDGAVGSLLNADADIFGLNLALATPQQCYADFTYPIYGYSTNSAIQAIYNKRTGLNGVYYSVLANSSTRSYFENTQRPNDQAIWANILQNSPRSLPTTEEAAVQQLLVGGWAYLAPGGTLNRILAKYCDVLAIDPKIYEKLYTTFAVRKGDNLILNKLNNALNAVQSGGAVSDLLNKYFQTPPSPCPVTCS